MNFNCQRKLTSVGLDILSAMFEGSRKKELDENLITESSFDKIDQKGKILKQMQELQYAVIQKDSLCINIESCMRDKNEKRLENLRPHFANENNTIPNEGKISTDSDVQNILNGSMYFENLLHDIDMKDSSLSQEIAHYKKDIEHPELFCGLMRRSFCDCLVKTIKEKDAEEDASRAYGAVLDANADFKIISEKYNLSKQEYIKAINDAFTDTKDNMHNFLTSADEKTVNTFNDCFKTQKTTAFFWFNGKSLASFGQQGVGQVTVFLENLNGLDTRQLKDVQDDLRQTINRVGAARTGQTVGSEIRAGVKIICANPNDIALVRSWFAPSKGVMLFSDLEDRSKDENLYNSGEKSIEGSVMQLSVAHE